jgi:DNA-binding winged helix-turn-helix (wHTH) protein/TolB-like protein/Flp pilus assembly protein TadD
MNAIPQRYAFGGFVLERSQKRLLRQDGPPVELTPRLFGALLLLVEHAGELVEKDALLQAVWPGLVVSENSLSQVIAGLRRTLGDDAQGGRYIRTVPRKGFRFVAPVTIPDAADSSAEAAAARAVARRRRLIAAAAVGGTGVAGLIGWLWHANPRVDDAPTTLAVLPFASADAPQRDGLAEAGMADSLSARLANVPGLAVRSPASTMRYAGALHDPSRAARELDVRWLVDGSVRRSGERLLVMARLLRGNDGTAAWSESFDVPVDGLFGLQDHIALRVTQALATALPAAAEHRPVAAGGTRSTEAYQLYLAGAWRAQGGNAKDIARSIALLEQALAIDPSYAQAWAMLGWTHRRRLWNADALPASVFAPSDEAVRRAIQIVPTLALARAGVGFSHFWYRYDWSGAEREFRLALDSNPNEPGARWGLAYLLLTQGRVDEGFIHMRRARENDPMSPVLHTLEASFLISDGRLEQAQQRVERALDIAPGQWLAHVAHGLLLVARRQVDAGLGALRRAAELAPDTVRPRAVLAVQLAAAGQAGEARRILDAMHLRAQHSYVPPTSLAMVHAALGQTVPALDALERAHELRDTRLIMLKDDPSWQPLRGQPRFEALKHRLGLAGLGTGLTSV